MSDKDMKLPPKVYTILDHEVEHILATIEVLEFEAAESGDVSEEMVQEAKDFLNGLSEREKAVSDIIKEFVDHASKTTSDQPDVECKVEDR